MICLIIFKCVICAHHKATLPTPIMAPLPSCLVCLHVNLRGCSKISKYHLKRVVSIQMLTFKELFTRSAQIESIFNSRPLTSQSSDPNDLLPLTPGHFLTSQPLFSIPLPDLFPIPQNRLTLWNLLRHVGLRNIYQFYKVALNG